MRPMRRVVRLTRPVRSTLYPPAKGWWTIILESNLHLHISTSMNSVDLYPLESRRNTHDQGWRRTRAHTPSPVDLMSLRKRGPVQSHAASVSRSSRYAPALEEPRTPCLVPALPRSPPMTRWRKNEADAFPHRPSAGRIQMRRTLDCDVGLLCLRPVTSPSD